MDEKPFSRTELLIGKSGLDKLKNSKVMVFGVGGVGSYTVECLARAGVGNITIIDNDTIAVSNLNRQVHATLETIGRIKVEVEKERILSINKECNVVCHKVFVLENNLDEIIDDDVDYIVDAIDTVSTKIALAKYCEDKSIKLISSMGTGNKLDPTKFVISDIYKTKVCPLAKVMRHELRKRGVKKLKVLYSEEVPIKLENTNKKELDGKRKKQTPGSISFVPPVAGMIIGGEVIKDILAS
ncbi:tRNA threonylcarbamoyladenosine dehydratase [Clostridium sp. HCP1S3_B4]|uniref:tRNA threonylcarbamoyladenosine dehydratase n=1 Tax=unclassified Clostridium TaxID=2614128 RepID=UPI002A7E5453|nr:tRNA threonylcarbamoyladenosine dehydratase [Clostridiales bacterium]MDY2729132.1 tRNA threonylcarbamoyladenosine dehydratase [Clostridium sp.]